MKYPVLFENSILTKRKNGEYSTYSWIDFFVILRVIIRILPRNNYLLIVPALRYFHVIRRSGIHKETCSRCAESVSTGKVVEWRRHCALVRLERGVFPCKCMRPWHPSQAGRPTGISYADTPSFHRRNRGYFATDTSPFLGQTGRFRSARSLI